MRHFALPALVVAALVGAPATVHAQRDSAAASRRATDTASVYQIRTLDGSTLVGRIAAEDSVAIRLETGVGTLTIPRASIVEMKALQSGELRNGELWFRDPNRTRLFFAPTGRMLQPGEAYYMNTYLLLQNFVGAPTKNLTIGGGFSLIPGVDPSNWAYYATPKVGVVQSENLNVAAGALIGYTPIDSGHGFGVLYGVGTFGGPDANVTTGVGLGYAGASIASRPVVMLGGQSRVSRRLALVTENYGYVSRTTDHTCDQTGCHETHGNELVTLVSYGVRFMGEKLSVDFAFANAAGSGAHWIFPGIPYLSFGVKL